METVRYYGRTIQNLVSYRSQYRNNPTVLQDLPSVRYIIINNQFLLSGVLVNKRGDQSTSLETTLSTDTPGL